MNDAPLSDAPPAVPANGTLDPTPAKKPRGRPPTGKNSVNKSERKLATPQHRIDQLKAELQKAEDELREHEARQAEIGWPVVIRHAKANPEFHRQLASLLRSEIKNKAELATMSDLMMV